MKIIDCFTFYNELDMLEYRLTVLDDIVDYFILVESEKTHAGEIKPLYYNENKERYAKWKHKIIHIIVELYSKEIWNNGWTQRRAIDRGIQKLNLNPNDLIIISDVDEIPNPISIGWLKTQTVEKMIVLEMDYYNFNIETFIKVPPFQEWKFARILPYSDYKTRFKYDCEDVRGSGIPLPPNTPYMRKAGWHLSFFGTPEFCVRKIECFPDELSKDIVRDTDFFKDIIKNKKIWITKDQELVYIPVEDNKNLPPRVDLLLKWFPPPKSE